VDPDSLVTPGLVAFWLAAVLRGLRRGHSVLGRFYDLTGSGTPKKVALWEEVAGYFLALGLKAKTRPLGIQLVCAYTQATRQFLFGIPSSSGLALALPPPKPCLPRKWLGPPVLLHFDRSPPDSKIPV
jgi:hypothetical protein